MNSPSAPMVVPRLPLLLAIGALCLFSLPFMVSPWSLNADASWLVEVSERVLAGQKLYVDVLETNPPMSIWLYLPSVWLAQQIGLRPEIMVFLFTLLVCLGSIALTIRIIKASGLLDGSALLAASFGLFYLFVVFPSGNFTQREHFAAVALLPFLTVLAARAQAGFRPRLLLMLVIGIGAGFSAAIKPHFLAAILLPVLWLAAQRRSLWPFFHLENLAAAGVFGLYALCFWLFASDYFTTIWPLVSTTYLKDQPPLPFFLIAPASLAFLLLAVCAGLFIRLEDRRLQVLLCASAGFLLAYIVQGKGWPYHAYPAAAFLVLALLLSILSGAAKRRSVVVLAVTACCVAVFASLMRNTPGTGDLAEELTRIKPNPSIMVVASDIAIPFPLVRSIDGTFVGRLCSNWITKAALTVMLQQDKSEAEKAVLSAAVGKERQFLLEDVKTGKPDIIVFWMQPVSWLDWATQDAAFKALLADYRPVPWKGSAEFALYQRVVP